MLVPTTIDLISLRYFKELMQMSFLIKIVLMISKDSSVYFATFISLSIPQLIKMSIFESFCVDMR
jgi:hypothetical protein